MLIIKWLVCTEFEYTGQIKHLAHLHCPKIQGENRLELYSIKDKNWHMFYEGIDYTGRNNNR
jgi:hypothetical protein